MRKSVIILAFAQGLKLHYRSKRRGFVYYVMGQIKQVGNEQVERKVFDE
jgi:hypothetical protein